MYISGLCPVIQNMSLDDVAVSDFSVKNDKNLQYLNNSGDGDRVMVPCFMVNRGSDFLLMWLTKGTYPFKRGKKHALQRHNNKK